MKDKKSHNTKYDRIAIKAGYIALLIFILAGIFILGYCFSNCWGCPIVGTVIAAFAILGAGWGIISILHKVIQNSWSLILSFVALFVYGIIVYSTGGKTYGDWLSNIFSPINSTLSIFFPSRGGYEEDLLNKIPNCYTFVHVLSYLYVALLGVSLFGRRVMNRSTYHFIRNKYKNVFWGYSDGGVLLANDIKEKTSRDKAVFVRPENMPLSSEMEKYRFEEVDGIEGIVLYKDFSKEIDIKAARHFFLTEDQDLNVKLAFMVLECIEKRRKFKSCKCRFICRIICKCKKCGKSVLERKPKFKSCKCRFICRIICRCKKLLKLIVGKIFKIGSKFTTKLYVRTELDHVDKYFTQKLKYIHEVNKDVQVEVHTINESELTARRFIVKYSPLDMPKVIGERDTEDTKKKFSILQLGYGWSGKAILDKLICNTQFDGWEFSATVFDRDLRTKHGFYPLLDKECIDTEHKNAVNYYNITTNPVVDGCAIEVGSERFKDWVIENISKFNRIVVALGDDTFNVHIALSIANILNQKYNMSPKESSKYIFAHIRDADCYTYFDMEITPISVFGNKDRIYTMSIIINDELDKLAKLMNFLYCNLKADEEFDQLIERLTSENVDISAKKEEYWSAASILDQDSSRAAATSIDNILRLMEWRRVKVSDPAPAVVFDISGDLERLAENEHRRWNAFHFTRGIKYWDVSSGVELSDFGIDKPKPNRIDKINSHAALVDYGDLDTKVDGIFNPKINEYNIANNKNVPLINMKENDRKLIRGIAGILTEIGCKIVKE